MKKIYGYPSKVRNDADVSTIIGKMNRLLAVYDENLSINVIVTHENINDSLLNLLQGLKSGDILFFANITPIMKKGFSIESWAALKRCLIDNNVYLLALDQINTHIFLDNSVSDIDKRAELLRVVNSLDTFKRNTQEYINNHVQESIKKAQNVFQEQRNVSGKLIALEALKLKKEGRSMNEISNELKFSVSSLYRLMRKHSKQD